MKMLVDEQTAATSFKDRTVATSPAAANTMLHICTTRFASSSVIASLIATRARGDESEIFRFEWEMSLEAQGRHDGLWPTPH
jgi:hypothetical protein